MKITARQQGCNVEVERVMGKPRVNVLLEKVPTDSLSVLQMVIPME